MAIDRAAQEEAQSQELRALAAQARRGSGLAAFGSSLSWEDLEGAGTGAQECGVSKFWFRD